VGGRQPARLQLEDLLRRFPVGWREQRAKMLDPSRGATVELADRGLLSIGE
jgi:hypothetical protein